MSRILPGISAAHLESLAAEVERSTAPLADRTHAIGTSRETAAAVRDLVATNGVTAAALALRSVATERREMEKRHDRRVELVWTGPEPDAAGTRDTAVVARELFSQAKASVLLSGYALFNARDLLEPLARRMAENPALSVRLYLNVQRREGDERPDDVIAGEYARRLLRDEWPGSSLPAAFYDPRSLARDPAKRAVLHAKCIVVDDRKAFITSANLTDSAHHRNIELGVLLDDAHFARALRMQFEGLVMSGELVSLA